VVENGLIVVDRVGHRDRKTGKEAQAGTQNGEGGQQSKKN